MEYLNAKSKKGFRTTTDSTIKYINARLNDGFSIDDFKKVIDTKCSQWMNTDNHIYLRPETLFGNKFEGYLNEKPVTEVKPQRGMYQ